MQYQRATIVSNTVLGPGHHEIVLQVPGPLPEVRAGHFLNLRCQPADKYSLMRPFSILDVNKNSHTISVYYKELGRLSSTLSSIAPGEQLDCLYPLGQPFPVSQDWSSIALVGGGVGLAPLLFASRQIRQENPSASVTAFFGGNSKADLVMELEARYQLNLHCATMDGSYGFHGTVVDCFKDHVHQYDAVLTCGPNPMMAALQKVLAPTVEAYASLEEYMACGVGACLGCVASIDDGSGPVNKPVCKDGPVFNLHHVRFAEH